MRSSPIARHHQIKEFAGAADKGLSGNVFVIARRFADEHDAALRIAVGKDELRRGRPQRAAFEFVEQRAQIFQCSLRSWPPRAPPWLPPPAKAWRRPRAKRAAPPDSRPCRRRGRLRAAARRSFAPERGGRRCRGRRNLVRHAVDRLLAEKRVGAGVEIEGDQFARFFMAGNIHEPVHHRNIHERSQRAPQGGDCQRGKFVNNSSLSTGIRSKS